MIGLFRLPPRRGVWPLAVVVGLALCMATLASVGMLSVPAGLGGHSLKLADSPPPAPSDLVATAVSSSEVNLSWVNPSGSLTDNYVYAYTGDSCDGSPFFAYDPGSPVTSIDWTLLSPATTYSWVVTAVSTDGEGLPSNCAFATTYGSPTELTATSTSFSAVSLAWTNPSGTLTDDYISAFDGGSCSGSPFFVYDPGAPITSLVWTLLSPATTYSWEVTAVTAYGEGPPSNCASATTFGSPTGLTATATSFSTVDLAWTNPSGTLTDNYIYAYNGGSCSGSPFFVYDAGASITTILWTTLSSATTYSWEVTAVTAYGEGPPSNCAAAMTYGGSTELTATASSFSTVNLTWTNPSGTLTDIYISAYTGGSCSGTAFFTYDPGAPITSITWTALSAASTYSWEVTADTPYGEGPPSNCASATTYGPASGLTASPTSSSTVNLVWSNPADPSDTLSDDYIAAYVGGSCSGTPFFTYDPGSPITSITWTVLSPATTYSWEVTAVTVYGSGPVSNCASTTTDGPATGLTATPSSSSTANLTWTNPSGTLTDDYISAFDGGSCSGSPFFIYDPGAPITSLVWTLLSPATTYSWEVTAVTAYGLGPASNCASVTTPVAGAPFGLVAAAASDSEIDLSWTNPPGLLLTDSHVYLWDGSSCSGSPIEGTDLGGVYAAYSYHGLVADTTYSFEVTVNSSGTEGPPSNCATAQTYMEIIG